MFYRWVWRIAWMLCGVSLFFMLSAGVDWVLNDFTTTEELINNHIAPFVTWLWAADVAWLVATWADKKYKQGAVFVR